jgi:hypothetical protein
MFFLHKPKQFVLGTFSGIRMNDQLTITSYLGFFLKFGSENSPLKFMSASPYPHNRHEAYIFTNEHIFINRVFSPLDYLHFAPSK